MFIILALIRGHFCVYASVRVELQLFICSSTALFGLEFAVTSPQVQECCPGWAMCAGGQSAAGNPPQQVCYSKPQVLSHPVPFCGQPEPKHTHVKYYLFGKLNKYSNDSLASAFNSV